MTLIRVPADSPENDPRPSQQDQSGYAPASTNSPSEASPHMSLYGRASGQILMVADI